MERRTCQWGAADLPEPLVLRPAAATDVKRVAEIEHASFSDPWSVTSFASLVINPDVFFRVAAPSCGGAVAGYIVAWFVAGQGEIANVAVAPEARGRGVGAMLLDAALAAAEEAGADAVYLEVRDSNSAARALYASRGFITVGRRRNYYRRPLEDALVLRKGLGPGAESR